MWCPRHPNPEPAPVAQVAPEPERPPVPDVPVPIPPVATPLPPPGGYEPLAGVSGTQILSLPSTGRRPGSGGDAVLVEGRRHTISKRATTIGRSRECDIVVQDSNASRLHAEIRHIGLDYFIVDCQLDQRHDRQRATHPPPRTRPRRPHPDRHDRTVVEHSS